MTWVAIGGAAVGVVGNAIVSDSKSGQQNGGAGASTTTKAPWSAAAPWLTSNIASGQALQQQYTDQPFNAQQQQAYNNQYAQSDYMRQLVPSLLNQMQGQQVGFDRNNQTAKPTAWNWGLSGQGGGGGNLGMGLTGADAAGSMQAAQAAQQAADAAKKTSTGDFKQFDPSSNPAAGYYAAFMSPQSQSLMTDGGTGVTQAFQSALGDAGGAGYGAFKYGSAMPQAGTQAYRDMNEYFSYGGNDPYNLYGKAPSTTAQVPVDLGMNYGTR